MRDLEKRSIEQVRNDEKNVHINDASSEKKIKLPKRRVAVMFGYNGRGYQGSQINPKMKTIEGQLLNAFCKAGCISEENSSDPNKVGLQRAARTDANVHACCNLVSLKLILNPTSLNNSKYQDHSDSQDKSSLFDQELQSMHSDLLKKYSKFHSLVQHINQFLPPEIHIWNLIRVQNSFNCRSYCESRVYEYSLPTWCFLPPKPGTPLHSKLSNQIQKQDSNQLEFDWWKEHSHSLSKEKTFKQIQFEIKKNYRISQSMIQKIQSVLDQFKGTHNFHNFTIGQNFNQPNSIRIMKDLKLSKPFLVPLESIEPHHSSNPSDSTRVDHYDESDPLFTEWISITIHGQSFMLHQIRKMVSLVILLCRTGSPVELIKELFGPKKARIPKAPGIGLILKKLNFPGYNKQMMNRNRKNSKKKNNKNLQVDPHSKDCRMGDTDEDNLSIGEPIESDHLESLFETFKSKVLIKQIYLSEKIHQINQINQQEGEESWETQLGLDEMKQERKLKFEEEPAYDLKIDCDAKISQEQYPGLKTEDENGEKKEENKVKTETIDHEASYDLKPTAGQVKYEKDVKTVLKPHADGGKDERSAKVQEPDLKPQLEGEEENLVKTEELDLKPHIAGSEEERSTKTEELDRASDENKRNHQTLASPPHPVLDPDFDHSSQADPFGVWMNYLDVYNGSDLEFLNTSGSL